jgi:galactoside O-acetyltransferase
MPFLTRDQLVAMSFRSLGDNVLISDKAAIYGADKMTISTNVRIDDFTVLSGCITIGRNVHISIFCNVAGGTEGVVFEDFAGLSPSCHVFTESDDYSGRAMTNPTVPHQYRRETKRPVRLGRHCIVGTNSLVLPGVSLGEGCAIGAMSMVTKSTEAWSVYTGVPAKKIKNRDRGLLQREQDYLSTEAPEDDAE